MNIIKNLRKRRDEAQGYREILRVGLPLVAGMGSSTIMQFTDRLFLSHYSVDAIAAAMPASIASMTIVMTLMGVCGYTTVLIAQYVGSNASHRVGPALWQGIWSAVAGSLLLGLAWPLAGPLFDLAGHDESIRQLEVIYFRVLTVGSGFALLSAAFSGFFSGQGKTRPIMAASIFGAVINVPLDYIFIFGGFGVPPLGILGAAIATVLGWVVSAAILGALIFTRKNEALYSVRSNIRFEWEMFRRLLRYGLPSGLNFFIEMVAIAWFAFEVGVFGTVPLAASNIAFSINSLVFLPMIGLNIALSSLVGRAMGQGRPDLAERATVNTLHLTFAYMLPLAFVIAAMPGQLMDIFKPGDLSVADFASIREHGVVFLYFIAVYTSVDAANIVYFGALKGAGDTLGIMFIMTFALVFLLILPIAALKYFGMASAGNYWIVITAYIIMLAAASFFRFYRRGWHGIRVVETAPSAHEE